MRLRVSFLVTILRRIPETDPRRQTMPELPSGTDTFLFTDIGGSTQLWERNAAAMQLAVMRHEQIRS
jgi:class 3 adenylate cyclase